MKVINIVKRDTMPFGGYCPLFIYPKEDNRFTDAAFTRAQGSDRQAVFIPTDYTLALGGMFHQTDQDSYDVIQRIICILPVGNAIWANSSSSAGNWALQGQPELLNGYYTSIASALRSLPMKYLRQISVTWVVPEWQGDTTSNIITLTAWNFASQLITVNKGGIK